MRIGIIGAGNMGGAIARGLAKSGIIPQKDIVVCSPNHKGELNALKKDFPNIEVSQENENATSKTDFIIIAVKPWLLQSVLNPLIPKIDFKSQSLVSIVAGASTNDITDMVKDYSSSPSIFRLIPNTAIAVGESMTIISSKNASEEQNQEVKCLFEAMGKVVFVEERLMGACTALTSCGIAYVMRYIRAAVEGSVELGIYPNQAKEMMMQTMLGAVKLLEATGENPEVEIDKVTTPGGITIKGLNTMEANGFSTAVIEGLKSSCK